jgi:hypothetical protein
MPDLPIACTLGPAALKARRDDLLGTLIRRAEERIDLPNGYCIRLKAEDGILARIAQALWTSSGSVAAFSDFS